MFRDTKYIIVDNGENGTEIPIIFSNLLSHNDIAQGYVGKVISAGFCQIDIETGFVEAFGKSDTLKIESRPQDTEIIKRELNNWK